MAERPAFQRQQYAFAAHIRDPEHQPAPAGIEDRRMGIYRELFFNNLNKLLGKTFPVLRKVLGEEEWRALVRDFMVRHRAKTPYFLEISGEFVEFLAKSPPMIAEKLPFLAELAHYEWAELALSVSTDSDDLSAVDPAGDLLEGVPVKSVLAWPLSYRYPVHRISKNFQPAAPGAQLTCLAIYREPDDELGFMELNSMTTALLERTGDNPAGLSGRELLLGLAKDIGYTDAAGLVEHGRQAMEGLRASGILVGALRRR